MLHEFQIRKLRLHKRGQPGSTWFHCQQPPGRLMCPPIVLACWWHPTKIKKLLKHQRLRHLHLSCLRYSNCLDNFLSPTEYPWLDSFQSYLCLIAMGVLQTQQSIHKSLVFRQHFPFLIPVPSALKNLVMICIIQNVKKKCKKYKFCKYLQKCQWCFITKKKKNAMRKLSKSRFEISERWHFRCTISSFHLTSPHRRPLSTYFGAECRAKVLESRWRWHGDSEWVGLWHQQTQTMSNCWFVFHLMEFTDYLIGWFYLKFISSK